MRSEKNLSAFADEVLDGGDRPPDPSVVSDDSSLQGNIQVTTDQYSTIEKGSANRNR